MPQLFHTKNVSQEYCTYFQHPLTDLDQVHVSQHITSAAMLQRVAAHLQIPQHKVQSILYDHRFSINTAALAMLGAFRGSVTCDLEAFTLLGEALRKSGLGHVVSEVLGKEGEVGKQEEGAFPVKAEKREALDESTTAATVEESISTKRARFM